MRAPSSPPLEPLEHEHTASAIRQRLSEPPSPSYLRDAIYGGIDGCVTTFAIVAGAAGAGLSSRVVVIMGLANVLADGLSMAAANYTGTKAESEEGDRLLAIERRHIALVPEGEREEIRQIFAAKGFQGDELERVVDVICSNEAGWAKTMVVEEYGRPLAVRSPGKAAVGTFGAFLLCGIVPLLPYLLPGMSDPFAISAILTAVTFFLIGCAKSRWTTTLWWRSGVQTLSIGGAAALLAYGAAACIEALI